MAFSEEHAPRPPEHWAPSAYSFKISHYAWEEEDYGISKSKFMIIGSSQRLNKIDSISFKIDNMDLDEVSSFKYLGIVIKNRLTWQDHVDQMFSKTNKKLGLLKRTRYCLPLDARLLFFNSYVQPLFDYADIVWGGYG